MSNIPSDIDCNAIQSVSVTGSPTSKNSDDKELSWSNVEDTDDDTSLSSVAGEEPLAQPQEQPLAQPQEQPLAQPQEQPLAQLQEEPLAQLKEEPLAQLKEQPAEEKPAEVQLVEEPLAQPVEEPVAEPQEVQKCNVPSLTINESDDDMPPLVSSDESSDESSDDMPQLVESSDEESSESDKETDDSDDEMPELVSDDEDIVHMLIRDTNCLRCRTAIQTLLSHDHDYLNGVEEENTLRPKNEFPSIITYILWLFIALHALNLVSTYCGHPSC